MSSIRTVSTAVSPIERLFQNDTTIGRSKALFGILANDLTRMVQFKPAPKQVVVAAKIEAAPVAPSPTPKSDIQPAIQSLALPLPTPVAVPRPFASPLTPYGELKQSISDAVNTVKETRADFRELISNAHDKVVTTHKKTEANFNKMCQSVVDARAELRQTHADFRELISNAHGKVVATYGKAETNFNKMCQSVDQKINRINQVFGGRYTESAQTRFRVF